MKPGDIIETITIQYDRSLQEYAVPTGGEDYYFTCDEQDAIDTFNYHWAGCATCKIKDYDVAPVNKKED